MKSLRVGWQEGGARARDGDLCWLFYHHPTWIWLFIWQFRYHQYYCNHTHQVHNSKCNVILRCRTPVPSSLAPLLHSTNARARERAQTMRRLCREVSQAITSAERHINISITIMNIRVFWLGVGFGWVFRVAYTEEGWLDFGWRRVQCVQKHILVGTIKHTSSFGPPLTISGTRKRWPNSHSLSAQPSLEADNDDDDVGRKKDAHARLCTLEWRANVRHECLLVS